MLVFKHSNAEETRISCFLVKPRKVALPTLNARLHKELFHSIFNNKTIYKSNNNEYIFCVSAPPFDGGPEAISPL